MGNFGEMENFCCNDSIGITNGYVNNEEIKSRYVWVFKIINIWRGLRIWIKDRRMLKNIFVNSYRRN